jgi:methylase of polypeptide subunit release factors
VDILNNSPTYSPSHYQKLTSYLSPIEELKGYLVKREDLFQLGISKGGKVRQCLSIVHRNLHKIKTQYNGGLITGCGLPSPQSTIVSSVANYFGLECIVVSPRYDNSKVDVNRINVSLSQKLGARIYGVGNRNPRGYKRDVKELNKKYGYYEIKFGMESSSVIDTTSYQVKNIPNELDNLVVICGSGLNLLGILKGIVKYKKKVDNVYAITLSKFFQENKKLYYDGLLDKEKYKGQLHIIPSPYPYQKLLKTDIPFLDWTYENKSWVWMLNNIPPSNDTLFWVVGIRNYDLENIEPIRWNKSKHEKELDKQRKKKLDPVIKRTNLHELKSNITYDEIQSLSFPQLSKWVDELRNEIVDIWDTGSPPIIGKSKDGIIKSFRKLKSYPIDNLLITDKNYPHHLGFIKNFTKVPCSQFFPHIYSTKIDNQPSIRDFFYEDGLKRRFKRHIVRNVRFDGLYSFSQYLSNPNGVSDTDFFQDWKSELNDDTGFFLERTDPVENNGTSRKVYLHTNLVKKFRARGILEEFDFRNVVDFDDTEANGYMVRYYSKKERIIPKILQAFRIGLGTQPAVNFPPLSARLIYELFLTDQDKHTIVDFCSGWGGRLLGALCSNRQIHYVGTDVNMNNKGCYENLGEFYNSNCDGKNTYEIYYDGAETIHKNKSFQKYKGKVSLCFTSPPYFGREQYSQDKEQSFIKFPNYRDWLNGFMKPLIKNSWDYLKPKGHLILNVADIKMGENNYVPLEQDTLGLSIKQGFRYLGRYDMVMSRMIGVNTDGVKNNWFDMNTKKTYKTEPIMIWVKDK